MDETTITDSPQFDPTTGELLNPKTGKPHPRPSIIPPIWGFGYTPYYVVGIVILIYIMRKK